MAQIGEGFAQYSAAPVLEILSTDFFNTIGHTRTLGHKSFASHARTGNVAETRANPPALFWRLCDQCFSIGEPLSTVRSRSSSAAKFW